MRTGNALVLASLLAVLLDAQAVSAAAGAPFTDAQGGHTVRRQNSISCAEGQRLLRRDGFGQIISIDCRGTNFVYRARRGGQLYEVAINRFNGEIVDLRRVGR